MDCDPVNNATHGRTSNCIVVSARPTVFALPPDHDATRKWFFALAESPQGKLPGEKDRTTSKSCSDDDLHLPSQA